MQLTPQLPQAVALLRSASHPLREMLSQLAKPLLQAPNWQEPAEQTPLALGKLQLVPQAPQLALSVAKFVSQPLPTLASQLPKPALQATEHPLVVQLAVPLFPLQALPQVPQWARLVSRRVSQPSL